MRRSGRTTRMLLQALDKALKPGQDVLVVGWRHYDCENMLRQLFNHDSLRGNPNVSVTYPRLALSVKGGGQIRFVAASSTPDWDWDQRRLRGWSPDVPVFIDHHTWEMYEQAKAAEAKLAAEKERRDERKRQRRLDRSGP